MTSHTPLYDTLQHNLPAVGAAIRNIIIFTAVLSIPLAAAQTLELSSAQTSSWILALYGVPSVLGLILTFYYRQPILLTGNIFVIIFISRLGDQLSYPELVGAAILAGAAVLVVTAFGLSEKLATWIPMPVIFGLLAGAVMPFVADIFTLMGDDTVLIGGIFLAYLASRRLLGQRVPAILTAVIAGLILTAVTGEYGAMPPSLTLESPEITSPDFTLSSILAATPVFVILITLQANVPSLLYMQRQDYEPPEFVVNIMSGAGTMLGSLLGPTGASLSLPVTSLLAGPSAGDHRIRHRSVYVSATAALALGLLAGIAADLLETIPMALLFGLAGLAVVDILANALERTTQGSLTLGPLLTFAVALSEISLFELGPFFWALVIGTGVSLLLERDALKALQDDQRNPTAH